MNVKKVVSEFRPRDSALIGKLNALFAPVCTEMQNWNFAELIYGFFNPISHCDVELIQVNRKII